MSTDTTPVLPEVPEYIGEDGYSPAERLALVAAALEIVPRRSRPRGVPGMITGETVPGAPSVDAALRVARFALDPYRGIPGVDLPWNPRADG